MATFDQAHLLAFMQDNFLVIASVTLLSLLILRPLLDGKRRRLPPGPLGLPLLGYLPFLARNHTDSLMPLFRRYGKIFSLRLGAYDVVFISDFEVLKRISKQDAFNHRPEYTILTNLLPHTLSGRESLS